MSKRYYLADIIGTGEADVDEFRTAVADHTRNPANPLKYEGGFPVGETGLPVHSWTLVIVEAPDHTPLLNDPRIDALPDFPLDGKVSSINTVAKNAMLAAMIRRGIDTSSVAGTDGYREVIRLIGVAANATFDENAFGV